MTAKEFVQKIADTFNEAYRIDPVAMNALKNNYVHVNNDTANHLSIVVMPNPSGHEQYVMRFLGLLNGALIPEGVCLVEVWDDDDHFLRYEVRDSEEMYGEKEEN